MLHYLKYKDFYPIIHAINIACINDLNQFMYRIFLILSLVVLLTLFLWGLLSIFTYEEIVITNPSEHAPRDLDRAANTITIGPPEISGWIAWWIEDDGYTVIEKHHKKIASVSPGWFKLDKNSDLVEIGSVDKRSFSDKAREYPITLYPMIVTDLTDTELAQLIQNEEKVDAFMEALLTKAEEYNIDGYDIDFENIHRDHKKEFSLLIEKLSHVCKKNDLYLSVTVQAQTGKDDWVGILGQDIDLIGKNADEVRIMIYDRHGDFSDPGPITPLDWYHDVVAYALQKIPREKIVIALPTYGYLWLNDGNFQSFQYKDFLMYMENKPYTSHRDADSLEIMYEHEGSIGFLSDAEAVIPKMTYARNKGLNRFSFWNFSGTDEKIFERSWSTMDIILSENSL